MAASCQLNTTTRVCVLYTVLCLLSKTNVLYAAPSALNTRGLKNRTSLHSPLNKLLCADPVDLTLSRVLAKHVVEGERLVLAKEHLWSAWRAERAL